MQRVDIPVSTLFFLKGVIMAKIKVKLLDRNLIRAFGGVVQMMEEGKAKRFEQQGKIIIDDPNFKKMEHRPPQHKAVFQAPEDKLIESFDNNRYPGPEDKLFPNIRKRK
jgi:hypothetical protein